MNKIIGGTVNMTNNNKMEYYDENDMFMVEWRESTSDKELGFIFPDGSAVKLTIYQSDSKKSKKSDKRQLTYF
jgi:hypothetical protein